MLSNDRERQQTLCEQRDNGMGARLQEQRQILCEQKYNGMGARLHEAGRDENVFLVPPAPMRCVTCLLLFMLCLSCASANLRFVRWAAVPSSARIDPPGTKEQPIQMSGEVGELLFAATYCRLLVLRSDLLQDEIYWWSPFSDCEQNGSLVYGTGAEIIGLQVVQTGEAVGEATGGETLVWLGLANFTFIRLHVDTEHMRIENSSASYFHLQFAERCSPVCCDAMPYPTGRLRQFAIDSRGFVWLEAERSADPLDPLSDIVWSIYGADLSGKFKAGELFRAIPVDQVCSGVKHVGSIVSTRNGTTFTLARQENVVYRVSQLPPGQVVPDPYWPGESRPYEVASFFGGVGGLLEAVFDETRWKLVTVGAVQIVSLFSAGNMRLSDIHIISLAEVTGNHLRCLAVDPMGLYAYTAGSSYYYQVELDTMREPVHPAAAPFFGGLKTLHLSFSRNHLQLIAQIGANGFLLYDAQDCANETLCNSCESCVGECGRYCVWNAATHSCAASNATREPQTCAVLDGPYPSSVCEDGGTQISLYSNFSDLLDYRCAFASAETAYGKPETIASFAVLNATVVGNRTGVVCSTPEAATSVYGDEIWVTVLGYRDYPYVPPIRLSLHSCFGVQLYECLSDSWRGDCGFCMESASCMLERYCSSAAGVGPVGNQSDYGLPRMKRLAVESGHWVRNGQPLPQIVDIPVSAPFDVETSIPVVLKNCYLSPSVVYECQWGPLGAPTLVSRAARVSDVQAACAAPVGGVGTYVELQFFAAGKQFAFDEQPPRLGFHDCASALKCSDCMGSLYAGCAWCPYTLACVARECPGNLSTSSCPRIAAVQPGMVPLRVQTVANISTVGLPFWPLASEAGLKCRFAAHVDGSNVMEPFTSPASFVSRDLLECEVPPMAQQGAVSVTLEIHNDTVILHPFSLFVYDCSLVDSCALCGRVESCGWCLENVTCVLREECAANLTWINNPEACPILTELAPFQGAKMGRTSLNISVEGLFPSESFLCSFSKQGCGYNATTAARLLDSRHLSCFTPQFEEEGFWEVAAIMQKSTQYSANVLSFVVIDCSKYNDSCGHCTSPRKAECGWCIGNSTCTTSAFCERESFVVTSCPTIVETHPSSVQRGTAGQTLRVVFSRVVTELQWTCIWGAGDEGAQRTVGVVQHSRSAVSCAIPRFETVQSIVVDVLYGGVSYAGPVTFGVSAPPKKISMGFSNWAAIICVLCTLFCFGVVLRISIFVLCGWLRNSPVIRAASLFFCQLSLCGAFVALVGTFFFIWEPSQPVCIIRPWFGCQAHCLIFAALYAKTYRIYRIYRNPKLKRVRLRKRSLLFWVTLLSLIDVIFLTLWSSIDPMDAVWVARGHGVLVKRCRGAHTRVFEYILFAYKLVFVAVGCVLSFVARSVPSRFSESKAIGLSMYLSVLVALFGLPLVYFGGLSEEARVIVLTLSILSLSVGSICVVFLPKIWATHFAQLSHGAAKGRALLRTIDKAHPHGTYAPPECTASLIGGEEPLSTNSTVSGSVASSDDVSASDLASDLDEQGAQRGDDGHSKGPPPSDRLSGSKSTVSEGPFEDVEDTVEGVEPG